MEPAYNIVKKIWKEQWSSEMIRLHVYSNTPDDYKTDVDEDDLQEFYDHSTMCPPDYSDDIKEFALIIMNEHDLPEPQDVSSALDLYMKLLNEVEKLTCTSNVFLHRNMTSTRATALILIAPVCLNIDFHYPHSLAENVEALMRWSSHPVTSTWVKLGNKFYIIIITILLSKWQLCFVYTKITTPYATYSNF